MERTKLPFFSPHFKPVYLSTYINNKGRIFNMPNDFIFIEYSIYTMFPSFTKCMIRTY